MECTFQDGWFLITEAKIADPFLKFGPTYYSKGSDYYSLFCNFYSNIAFIAEACFLDLGIKKAPGVPEALIEWFSYVLFLFFDHFYNLFVGNL